MFIENEEIIIPIQKAFFLIDRKKIDLAKELLNQALALEPDNPIIHALFAFCMQNQKKSEEALEIINKAIGLEPEESIYYSVKAFILENMKRYDEAEEVINEAISLENNDAENYILLGKIKKGKKEWKDALEVIEKGLELEPDNEEGLYQRAFCLLEQDRLNEADDCIDRLLQVNPESSGAYNFKGVLYDRKGLYEKSLGFYMEALRLDPDNETASKNALFAAKLRNKFYKIFYKIHGKLCWHNRLCPFIAFDFFASLLLYLSKEGKKYVPHRYLRRYFVNLVSWLIIILMMVNYKIIFGLIEALFLSAFTWFSSMIIYVLKHDYYSLIIIVLLLRYFLIKNHNKYSEE